MIVFAYALIILVGMLVLTVKKGIIQELSAMLKGLS